MSKKILSIFGIIAVGIFIGVTVAGMQIRVITFNTLLRQQTEILTTLKKQQEALDQLTKADHQGPQGNVDWNALLGAAKNAPSNVPPPAQPPQPQGEDFSKVYNIPQDHSPLKGKKSAPVTIVEFVDFQCPFCARFHAPVVETLSAYPDKVNYILKNFPLSFHPQSRPAAKAALAAGEQGKYYEMVDALLENNTRLSEETFKELAGKLGLNVKNFLKDYKDKDAQWEQYIQADMKLADQVDVRGTPTFYINGHKTNARDLQSFKQEIDGILNKK